MHKLAHTLTLIAAAAAIAGCGISNPYQHTAATTTTTSTSTSTSTASSPAANPAQNPGEPPAPPPPAPASQAPASVRSTPAGAITQFATLYMNWTWRTLAAHERELAALSVGPARLSEQQAAAAAVGDSTIAQSRVYNSGQIISIAPSRTNAKQWVSSPASRPAATANTTASKPPTTSPSPSSRSSRTGAGRSRNGSPRSSQSTRGQPDDCARRAQSAWRGMPAREHARRLGAAAACVWLLTAFGVLLAAARARARAERPSAPDAARNARRARERDREQPAGARRPVPARRLPLAGRAPDPPSRRPADRRADRAEHDRRGARSRPLGRPAAAIRAAAPARMDRPWHRRRGLADRP